ncbi:MAG: hypothetical protein Q8N47_06790 [Bryobacterales bacterium]|nr:hypothetical protein [Bryobacterales bacterium]
MIKQKLMATAALGLMFAAAAQAQFRIKLPKRVTDLATGKVQSVPKGQAGQMLPPNTNQAPGGKMAMALQFAQIGLRTCLAASGHGAPLAPMRAVAIGAGAAEMDGGGFGAGTPDLARGAIVSYLSGQQSGTTEAPKAEDNPLGFDLHALALGEHKVEAVTLDGKR